VTVNPTAPTAADTADRMVAEIASSAARISELIASVKTYSHMDRSSEHKPVDVREGLDSTLTMLGHKLKKKSVRLARDYSEDLPLIPGNAGELNQVWTNLIDNAADAITESGTENGTITLRTGADDGTVHVDVEDNGSGIDAADVDRIFDAFFTTKPPGSGTGLGLDISYSIVVHKHRGAITVDSEPGRTVFRVELPVSGPDDSTTKGRG